jgi:hypothetical protein
MVYGGVDWVATALSADEHSDLTDPASWSLVPPVGNPAALRGNEMRELFDVAFRPDADVRKSIIGSDLPVESPEQAWEAGFGAVYWMEGVATRQQDRHGGSGTLLSIMRVNNDLMCDLAALLEIDDSAARAASAAAETDTDAAHLPPPLPKARFLRYTSIPGLGVSHPAILYDEKSDLYWMASNLNRDDVRDWRQPAPGSRSGINPPLHITSFSKCEIDRSTLGLHFSPNLLNWQFAGLIDYSEHLGRHFTYPHMVIDGEDLLVVTRASFVPGAPREGPASPLDQFYNNHNSKVAAFHRIRGFRALALKKWAVFQGEYSGPIRRASQRAWPRTTPQEEVQWATWPWRAERVPLPT